jgi:glycosyltransferase involved in cell wall biosynthesis
VDRDARLLLVGSAAAAPEYDAWLRRAADERGLSNVHLLGHVSDAARAAYYRVARVYVSASEHEGFGLPLLEAMHHGAPVVARDAGAVAGTIGPGGIVVRDAEPRRLAALVGLVAQDDQLRSAMVDAARRRLADFAPDRVAESLVGAVAPAIGRGE